MKTLFAALLAVFTRKPKSPFHVYMAQAREMMRIAKADKALGYVGAAQAAMQSAQAYRAAAHASVYYGTN